MKIRRQVYELTVRDLTEHPIWEFALDEEGEDGQDEATVRPWSGAEPLDPSDGMFVVRARFVLADGSQHVGYLTPPVQGDGSVATLQPIIITEDGQLMFWRGAGTPSPESLEQSYRLIQRTSEQLFPLSFKSDVSILGGPVSGSLEAFVHYRSITDWTIAEAR